MRKLAVALTLFLLYIPPAFSQVSFDERLSEIKENLNILADSIAPGLNDIADFSVNATPLPLFLRAIAQNHNLNIQVDPSINMVISNSFSNVVVKDLLYFICKEFTLDIKFINTIMSFNKYIPPAGKPEIITPKELKISYDAGSDKINLDLSNDSLNAFVRQITNITNKNVVASKELLETKVISAFIKDMQFDRALEQIAYINNLSHETTRDGVHILKKIDISTPQRTNRTLPNQQLSKINYVTFNLDSTINFDVQNIPAGDLLKEVSLKLNKNYALLSEISGTITATVNQLTFPNFLKLILSNSPLASSYKNGTYFIGDAKLQEFNYVELVILNFRSIEDIINETPKQLLEGIEIIPYKELNGLILNGETARIEGLKSFINIIDQPFPNIQIEVIVVEMKKGFNLQTGIRAFLSDSVPKTSGQVFPGVDVAVSSRSINDALDRAGLVNLGRVTPRFYATLQALEDNNNIDIRSTPKLSTLNGHEATLTIGESVYYVEQTLNISGGVTPITTTTQRFNRVEANLSIVILPVVSGNEHITLNLLAEFSNFIPPEFQGAPPGNATRRFESKIRVQNEEMIILGGLEEIRKSETSSGTPVLSRIPVLKWLFSSRSKQKNDSQLVVFIKPTIIY